MLYHLAEPGLAPGHIIHIGRWGAAVLADENHHWRKIEERFDYARTKLAPLAPSRFVCAYYFDSLDHIEVLHGHRPTDAVYEVEKVKPETIDHRANMHLVDPALGDEPDFEVWGWRAEEYWQPTKHAAEEGYVYLPEFLTLSPLRVVRQLREPMMVNGVCECGHSEHHYVQH